MTRLAANRETHLTPAEIAAEALRQFDAPGDEPSIRSLAAALKVAPSAIYHHYGSRADIVRAAVALVWEEATQELLALVPNPFEADPGEVLVASGLGTRRAWLAHYRLAPYMAATPESNEFVADALSLLANILERMGLTGERAASALHTYSSFMIGAVLFAAARCAANEQLEAQTGNGRPEGGYVAGSGRRAAQRSSEETRVSIDEVMDLSVSDPARDEELFADGLRRLVASLGA
jgi:AcrR family transcriptional regulator